MNKSLITTAGRMKRMLNRLQLDHPLINDWENYELSFEYVIASLFPDCDKQYNKLLTDEYTKGYIQGREDTLNEIKEHN